MSKQNEQAKLDALAQGIAAALPGWSVKPLEEYDRRRWLTHETGAEFGFAILWNKPRIEVYGCYPLAKYRKNGQARHYYPLSGMDMPNITCAIKRGPEAIAKDIERRFLPRFLELHELALEHVAKREQEQDNKEATMKRLADVLGVQTGARLNTNVGKNEGYSAWVTIESAGEASVNMKISSLNVELAVQVCRLLIN